MNEVSSREMMFLVYFFDFEKTLDRVDWVWMMMILKGMSRLDRRFLANLYMNQYSVIKVDGVCSEPGMVSK